MSAPTIGAWQPAATIGAYQGDPLPVYAAKSVILDIADNYGNTSYLSIRSIDFWNDEAKITLTSGFTAYATTEYSALYGADLAFDTSTNKTSDSYGNAWMTTNGSVTNQRLIIVFDTPLEFDSIVVNNAHESGGSTNRGAQNVKINVSSNAITDTTYNAAISNSTEIYDGTFDEHIASNVEDPQILTLGEEGIIYADPGEYIITGFDADLSIPGEGVTADPGNYSLTGFDAALGDSKIIAESGAYTLSGSELGLDITFLVEPGSLVLTGNDVTFIPEPGNTINAESGSYALTGSNVTLSTVLGTGSYALTGFNATLGDFDKIYADSGAYGLTWSEIDVLHPESGSYSLIGSDISSELVLNSIPYGGLVYFFTLTGEGDGTTDVEIPISSVQARLRSGTSTFMQVVVPGLDYASQISLRPNGSMQLDMAYILDGVYFGRETIIEVNLEDIKIYEGTGSKSIILTGHKQKTYVHKSMTLSGSVYRSFINSQTRYRLAEPNVYIHPGDTITVDADTFNANIISYFISANSSGITVSMEISEN